MFVIYLLLNLYLGSIFWDPLSRNLCFSLLNFDFQIFSQYENSFRSICVISFDNNQTSIL